MKKQQVRRGFLSVYWYTVFNETNKTRCRGENTKEQEKTTVQNINLQDREKGISKDLQDRGKQKQKDLRDKEEVKRKINFFPI